MAAKGAKVVLTVKENWFLIRNANLPVKIQNLGQTGFAVYKKKMQWTDQQGISLYQNSAFWKALESIGALSALFLVPVELYF